MARVRLDRAALTRTLTNASRRELKEAARQVVNRARVLAPVRTGRLRGSIRADPPRIFSLRGSVTVGSDVEYAGFVNDGTPPHDIRPIGNRASRRNPNRPGMLRFVVGGRVVYAREVRHPGTKAQPFLDRALREVAAQRGYSFRIRS